MVCNCVIMLLTPFRNFFGGARLLSNILKLMPVSHQICSESSLNTPSTVKPAPLDQNENIISADNTVDHDILSSDKELSDLLASIDTKSAERTSLSSLLSSFTSTLAVSSSKRVHVQLCDAIVSITGRGLQEATVVVSSLTGMFLPVSNLSFSSRVIKDILGSLAIAYLDGSTSTSSDTKIQALTSSHHSPLSNSPSTTRTSSINRLLHLVLVLASSPYSCEILSQSILQINSLFHSYR